MLILPRMHRRRRAEEETRGNEVVTVGKIDIGPGAINSVPRVATVHLDVRDIDMARRDKVHDPRKT